MILILPEDLEDLFVHDLVLLDHLEHFIKQGVAEADCLFLCDDYCLLKILEHFLVLIGNFFCNLDLLHHVGDLCVMIIGEVYHRLVNINVKRKADDDAN